MENINLKFLSICENFLTDAEGKYSLVNVFTQIKTPKVPLAYKPFYVVVGVNGEVGEYKEDIEIINTTTDTVIFSISDQIKIENEDGNIMVVNLPGIIFENFGKYAVKVKISGKEVTELPNSYITVIQKTDSHV
jgi:hypothetical protein